MLLLYGKIILGFVEGEKHIKLGLKFIFYKVMMYMICIFMYAYIYIQSDDIYEDARQNAINVIRIIQSFHAF